MIRVQVAEDLFGLFDAPVVDVEWRPGLTVRGAVRAHGDPRGEAIFWADRKTARATDHVADGSWVVCVERPGFQALGPLATQLIISALSILVSIAIQLLFPPPRPAIERDDDSSQHHGFGPLAANRAPGLPRPIALGEFRTGGHIISEYVSAVGFPPVVTYHALQLLSEGECESVNGISEDTPSDQPLSSDQGTLPSGMQINGNPAENLDGVELHVRTGRNEQEPIPGFERTPQQFHVGLTLLQEETADEVNTAIVITDPLGTGDDAIWDAYGEKFSILATEADGFRILLNFPSGLYRLDQNGNLIASFVQVQARYREIDDLGAEITTGGPTGDGWVRLLPFTPIVGPVQGSFPFQIERTFYNPQTYTPENPGRALTSIGEATGGASMAQASATFPPAWTPGAIPDEFTLETWIGITPGSLPTSPGVHRVVADWTNGGRGVRLVIAGVFTPFGVKARPMVGVGAGTLTFYGQTVGVVQHNITEPPNFNDPLPWRHLVVTWRRQESGQAPNLLEMYLDGALIAQHNLASPWTVPATGWTWRYLSDGTTGGAVRVDEPCLYQRYFNAQDVAARYSGGVGVNGSFDVDLVMGHHFQSTGSPQPSFGASANPMTIGTNSTSGIGQGIVPITGGGTPRRSRYAVEVLRINRDSTSARVVDEVEYQAIIALVNAEFSYPNSCLAGIKVRATDQLGTSTPNPTHLLRGIKFPVWDGVSQTSPTFEFKWTRNVAYQLIGLLTNARYGVGQQYKFEDLLFQSFFELAIRNDEIVPDAMQRLTTAAGQILDARYDSTTVDPVTGEARGSLLLITELGTQIPDHWHAGYFIRIYGFPTPLDDPALTNDVNTADATGGYEIASIESTPTPRVTVYWDRLDEADPWTDGQLINTLLNPDSLDDYDVEYEGGERRHECDTILDVERPAWDTLNELAATARAVLAPLVGKVRVIAEVPRPVTGLVGRRDLIPGSFEFSWAGRKSRHNVTDIQFRDRGVNYERSSTGPVEGESVLDETDFSSYRVKNIEHRHVTRRSECVRQARFINLVNERLIRQGKGRMDKTALSVLVGQRVLLAHDLLPRGQSGHVIEDASSLSAVKLDRTLVIAGGETWIFWTTHPNTGAVETAEIDSGVGTYEPGDTLSLATPLTFLPPRRHPYIACREGDELTVGITRTELGMDLSVEFEFVEYSPAIFEDHVETSLVDDQATAVAKTPQADWIIPPPVENLSATILTSRVSGGALVPVLHVSWSHPDSGLATVASTVLEVFVNGSLALKHTVQGLDQRASITMPMLGRGDEIEVQAMATSPRGARYGLKRSPKTLLRWDADDGGPPAPENITASWQGDEVSFAWDLPQDARGCSVVCRRGNWVLGTPVFESAPGADSVGPLPWSKGRLEFRCRDALGRFSPAAVLELEIQTEFDSDLLDLGYQSQAWENFGIGWRADIPGGMLLLEDGVSSMLLEDGASFLLLEGGGGGGGSADAELVGFEVDAGGALTMSAGFLDATWTSVDPLLERTKQNRLYRRVLYLSAWADTILDWPITDEQAEFAAESPRASQMTAQGPLSQSRVRFWIEFRLTNDAVEWGPWQRYKAQVVRTSGAQWRLRAQRDAEDINLRVLLFRTEALGRLETLYDRTPEQTYLHEEVF